jgi:hypothetical protein
MAYGARQFARLTIAERLTIGKKITELKEEQGLTWPIIRASYRGIAINTAKKFIKEYKDSLHVPGSVKETVEETV